MYNFYSFKEVNSTIIELNFYKREYIYIYISTATFMHLMIVKKWLTLIAATIFLLFLKHTFFYILNTCLSLKFCS